MLKKIIAVMLGYAIFAVSALSLFKLSEHDPHATPTTLFMIITAVYGAAFSLLAGFITQGVAQTKNLKVNYALAVIIGGFAVFSLFKTVGNHWSQLLAIFIFAPVSIAGGYFYLHRRKS